MIRVKSDNTKEYEWEVVPYSEQEIEYAMYIDHVTFWAQHKEQTRIGLSISNQSDCTEIIDFISLGELDEFIERLGKARATFKELLEKK